MYLSFSDKYHDCVVPPLFTGCRGKCNGSGKSVGFAIIIPLIVTIISFNGGCDTFHAIAVETFAGFGGNQAVSELFWRAIAAVADNDHAVTIAAGSAHRNEFFSRLL